ncbi:MAG: type II toxin-antitoxin system VapC family toxin [bacterium]|nr:type II toxin-antitoxin system VapC family toxin [bacterium]
MTTLILDSSVIIKWVKFQNEESVETALSYYERMKKNEIKVIVPDLILYEISNFASRDLQENRSQWEEMINNLFTPPLEIILPDSYLIKSILEITSIHKVSAYDASYLALAKRYNSKLVTADKKLLQTAPELTISL